jgi:hypothetical protein
MAEENKVNAGTIALVGFVATVLVVEIILLLMVLYYHVAAQQAYEKDISQPAAELVKIETAQRAKLNEYRWADPQKKIVAIPVSRAMKLVVEELAAAEETASETPVAPGGKEGEHER